MLHLFGVFDNFGEIPTSQTAKSAHNQRYSCLKASGWCCVNANFEIHKCSYLEILSFRYCCVGKITIAILRFLGSRSRFLNVSSVSRYCFIFSSVSIVYFLETFDPFIGLRFTSVSIFLLRRFSLI